MSGRLQLLRIPGRRVLASVRRTGRASLFLLRMLGGTADVRRHWRDWLRQVYAVGFLSLLIIIVSALFVGMVLGLQGYNTLAAYGSEQSLGVFVATALVRELGPVICALLVAGRAGSALTAEIGLMKATEQLAGMEMMAVDPLHRVIAPRFLAGVVSMPILACIFTLVAIWGGYLVGVGLLGVDAGAFWSQMQDRIAFGDDVVNGVLIKSLVFGIAVFWIAVFEGYDTVATSGGVARATTRTVVHASLAILGLDFTMTALMFND